ncbi:MAG: YkgJ family cysteine cluster protein [Clostridiales bacterium]|nr:YkgJ family cysteine cluster protein [Clostridiales bacterium]
MTEIRTFLKCNADEEELDQQFFKLHEELFSEYDCRRCRNCCRMYQGSIPPKDLEKDAEHLGMTAQEFMDQFLIYDVVEDSYQTKHRPCDFLNENNECLLGDCRPESCKKYPYTDQTERMQSLLNMLDIIEICPVAFEIYERLKDLYGFKRYR